MAPVNGEEIGRRRDSIGSGDAYRELQELSSVQLLRDSILRSISTNNAGQNRYGVREEIASPSTPSIEVKFLEKRCSSFSYPKPQSEQAKPPTLTSAAELPEKNQPQYPPLPDFEISGSFEASGEFLKDKNEKETEGLKKLDEISEDTPPRPKSSGKNSLKLAIRSRGDGIFEDCSTYNISCPDASPEFRGNEIFTNSIAGSYSSTDLETSSETNYSFSDSELAFSGSVNSPDSPEEQTSLCDTFFPQFIDNENGHLPKSRSPHLSRANRKKSTQEQQARGNSQALKEEGAKGIVDGLESHQDRRRNSKKLRRRDRKSHSNDPFVYECPKCGVSYVIASKMANDGVCLHCDLWTSVEPEFMKREKLLTWNTCRIC